MELLLAAFDPDGTRALGYRTRLIGAELLALLATTVMTAVPAPGNPGRRRTPAE
ncbi:hypothetical protein [Actinoallomurus rhizosphaericola]|uniref:hypothetical protein n=1 Tax=Actinoallomurus rhizosphaericola TaxID=2952536 RepID=UPI002093C9A4|nr:hypothetical protein [Actinoallomurus rhizosphaericola]MCO6000165.1 hypothetical protein [Actinoallomurus rhizosphaericola]